MHLHFQHTTNAPMTVRAARYLGNVAPWPPETHYRCVEIEGCGEGWLFPPSAADGEWSVSKRYGREPAPVVSLTPCVATSDEL